MLGKKSSEKSAKKPFFIFTRISCTRNGGKKRAKQFFHEHTYSAGKKCWEKIVGKRREKVFLYSHEYRDQKMEGKKRAKQFFQKHMISASKK